jgi:cytochrome bd-type quinol oxidase subunit 1
MWPKLLCGVLFLLASIVLRPRRFRGVESERRPGDRRDLGLFLFRLLGFAVPALLTFCHRNPPLNEARGCEPGVTRDGRAFRCCKQPLEVGENVRNEPGPPKIFGGLRLRKQDQKITGFGHGFNPAGGRPGEKQVLQFLLAPPQDRPPVVIPFFTFRIMVGCGLIMLAVAWLGSYLSLKNRIERNRFVLWLVFLSFPLPFIAVLTGWYTAEVGRQPWVVYGVLRTADAMTPFLTAREAGVSYQRH